MRRENKRIRNRKLNRLRGRDYAQYGWYFVTICVRNRELLLADIRNDQIYLSDIGKYVKQCWENIPDHFPNARLDEYIIMPNHIHGIIIVENFGSQVYFDSLGNKNFCSLQPVELASPWQEKWSRSLSSIIRGFKIGVTKLCRDNNYEYFKKKKSFYDHIIRNEATLSKIRRYIVNNPAKWEIDRNNRANLWM